MLDEIGTLIEDVALIHFPLSSSPFSILFLFCFLEKDQLGLGLGSFFGPGVMLCGHSIKRVCKSLNFKQKVCSWNFVK